jgi:hypothetical protein
MGVYWLERLGSLMAGGGITYAAYVATKDISVNDIFLTSSFHKVLSETGPMEACALGIIIWIYAKWRKHVEVR